MSKRINHYRNEKGITLIELLAVIVILAIIAAIAVPAIGNMIENSKKDAIIANAMNMVEGTRLLMVSESNLMPSENNMTFVPLGYLVDHGYMNKFNNHGSQLYAQDGNIQDYNINQPINGHHNWTNAQTTYVVVLNNNGNVEYYVRVMLHNNHEVIPYRKIEDVTRNDVTLHYY